MGRKERIRREKNGKEEQDEKKRGGDAKERSGEGWNGLGGRVGRERMRWGERNNTHTIQILFFEGEV